MSQVMNIEILASRDAPNDVELDGRRQYDPPAPVALRDALGALLKQGARKTAIVTRYFEFDETPIRAALFLEIGMVDDAALP